jgi:hypothetical protein
MNGSPEKLRKSVQKGDLILPCPKAARIRARPETGHLRVTRANAVFISISGLQPNHYLREQLLFS